MPSQATDQQLPPQWRVRYNGSFLADDFAQAINVNTQTAAHAAAILAGHSVKPGFINLEYTTTVKTPMERISDKAQGEVSVTIPILSHDLRELSGDQDKINHATIAGIQRAVDLRRNGRPFIVESDIKKLSPESRRKINRDRRVLAVIWGSGLVVAASILEAGDVSTSLELGTEAFIAALGLSASSLEIKNRKRNLRLLPGEARWRQRELVRKKAAHTQEAIIKTSGLPPIVNVI